VAVCFPSDAAKKEYDKKLDDMLGYTCMSPEDTGAVKKYIRNLLKDLDRIVTRVL
jgi:hypothetical protein